MTFERRHEIDSLRAIAVVSVFLYHLDKDLVPGGFIGVDIFFVISGFIITKLIIYQKQNKQFSFVKFYKGRAARLLPSLIFLLIMVMVYGTLFLGTAEFDQIGKEIFFAALGLLNILYSQGLNYFIQDISEKPIMHLWSLGVEEQFYLLWPLVLIFILKFKKSTIIYVYIILVSSFLLVLLDTYNVSKHYFLPQYRAFELLIGVMVAFHDSNSKKIKSSTKEIVTVASLMVIIGSLGFINESHNIPGSVLLIPLLATGSFIHFSPGTICSKYIANKFLTFIGLLSYPIYLFHQPVISFFDKVFNINSDLFIFIIILSTIFLSFISYKYLELPIRHRFKQNPKSSEPLFLLGITVCISIMGLLIAKSGGFPSRFKLLNPYAATIINNTESSFHNNFKRGVHNFNSENKVLFFGDSTLQQYVVPISNALNIKKSDITCITRGGALLLKGSSQVDQFSDISRNDLYDSLYNNDNNYKLVVFSQSWKSYMNSFPGTSGPDDLSRWNNSINQTIRHFSQNAENIVLIGGHLEVANADFIKPSLMTNELSYKSGLSLLNVSNKDWLTQSVDFFNKWSDICFILHPLHIWRNNTGGYTLHNDEYSFFSDAYHFNSSSNSFLSENLSNLPIIKLLGNF